MRSLTAVPANACGPVCVGNWARGNSSARSKKPAPNGWRRRSGEKNKTAVAYRFAGRFTTIISLRGIAAIRHYAPLAAHQIQRAIVAATASSQPARRPAVGALLLGQITGGA